MHDDAYIGGRSENNINASYMMISGGRTKQLDIFCCVTGSTSDFSQFHSCGTYSVLSRSDSIVCVVTTGRTTDVRGRGREVVWSWVKTEERSGLLRRPDGEAVAASE